jgi:hypothetical protein
MFRVAMPERQADNFSQEDIERLGGNTALMTAATDTPHSLYGGGLLVRLEVPVQLDSQDAAEFVNTMNRWELSGAVLPGLELPPLFGSWCLGPRGPTFVTFIPNHLGAQIPGVLQNVMIWNQQRTQWLRRCFDALNSAISPDLIRAYALTDFCVLTEEPFAVRIGQRSVQLAKLHAAHQTDCSAFITAFNPGSDLLGEAANEERHAALLRELYTRELAFVEGEGKDPSNEWPGERSVLVFGMVPEAAKALGAQFGQNAVVWSGADAIPRLILLR